MSNTLYRKYRPKKFDELIGQNHVKISLENQLNSGNIAHAYLFTGPRGVGKTTTARLLAAAVNFEEGVNVDSILNGKDIDVIEIDAASNTSVDNVRENIIENSRFTPNIRKYKVFIIDEVHMLSIAAFNALLKILEEPPTNTIFILATTELHKLPATIVSRCQKFDFKKISAKEIVERLNLLSKQEGVFVDETVLYNIARQSEGCLRDAESLLGQVLSLGEKNITQEQANVILPSSHFVQVLELVKLICNKDTPQSIIYINDNLTQGIDINQFFVDLLEVLRKILICKITSNLDNYSFELSEELEIQVIELSKSFSQNQILKMIDIFTKKRLDIKHSILPQMPLELGVIEYIESQTNNNLNLVELQNSDLKKKPLKIENFKEKDILSTINKKSESEVKTLRETPTTHSDVVDELSGQMQSNDLYDITLTIETVRNNWEGFLSELQKENPSLVLILKNAEPSYLEDGVLKIGYKYVFHKDKIMNGDLYDVLINTFNRYISKIKKIEGFVLSSGFVSEFIQEITQDDDVEFIADSSIQENTTSIAESRNDTLEKDTKPEDLINNLVQAFGGRVIE